MITWSCSEDQIDKKAFIVVPIYNVCFQIAEVTRYVNRMWSEPSVYVKSGFFTENVPG